MKLFLALFFARNKEFFRDRGSLFWALIMPPILIAVVALAISSNDQTVFNIGVYRDSTTSDNAELPSLLKPDYIRKVDYVDFDDAILRLQHHQLDLLVAPGAPLRYWVNDESLNGAVLEDMLQTDSSLRMQREQVSGRAIRYVDWVIPGILGMNIMYGGLFGIGFVIVRYRKNGVLKRFQATPVTPFQFLSAQLISRLWISLFTTTVVFFVANWFLDLVMLGSYFNLVLVALLGIMAILSIALLIAARLSSEELTMGLLNLVTFPMLLLSEVWFSLDIAPSWLRGFSQALPLTHLVGAARKIMIEGAGLADISQHLLYLIVITVVCMGVSAKLFRWN